MTGTRTPEASQRSTVKTDVVTREEAERRGATNVAEALATQPGVRVDPGAYGYLGGASAIQIQGFDLQRVLILEDGEPVVGDVGGAIDLANIPTSDIERIEIVTGPTSALYGSSAIGGVVNIITAPPRREGASGRARLEGRSRKGVLAQGNAAYRSGALWAGVDSSFTRSDGIARTPGLPDLQLPDVSRLMVGVRGGAAISDRVDVRVRARYFRDRQDGLSSQVAPGLGRFLIDEPADTDRFTLHVIERVDLGKGSSLRFTIGRQWVDNTTASIQQGSAVGDTHERHNRMQSFEGVATVADGPRTWVAGARAEAESYTQQLSRTESLTGGLVTHVGDEVVPQTLGRAAVYTQLQWKLGEQLTVLPGVRGEVHSRYGGAVTPRLAMAWIPSNELTLRVSGGRGFRAPTAKELGFVFDHSAFGYRVLGSADLRPETSWGVNGDATWRPAREYTLRAGTFMNWVDGLIDLDLAGGSSGGGAVVDYRYKNFGKARTFGAQLGATARFGERFSAELAYDYLWTRDDVNDQPLGGRPPHTVTASLRATPIGKVEIYGRWRASSDAFVSAEARSPAYQTFDVRVSHPLWKQAQGYVGALNLLDVHQEPGRIGDLRPPMGRVLYLGLRADLPWEEP